MQSAGSDLCRSRSSAPPSTIEHDESSCSTSAGDLDEHPVGTAGTLVRSAPSRGRRCPYCHTCVDPCTEEAHVLEHVLKARPHACPMMLCPYRAATPDALERHALCNTSHPDDEDDDNNSTRRIYPKRLWMCLECDFHSPHRERLQSHLTVHSTEKPFICPVIGCDFRTVRKATLTSHLRRHTHPKTLFCPICRDFSTRLADKLEAHIRIKHEGDRPFACPDCPYAGTSATYLQKHILQMHGDGNPQFQCTQCTHRAMDVNGLKTHMRTHNADDKPYQCPDCPFRTAYSTSLKEHRNTHTGATPHKCPYCKFETRSRQNILPHKRTQHKAEYAAEQERKALRRRSAVSAAMPFLTQKPVDAAVGVTVAQTSSVQ